MYTYGMYTYDEFCDEFCDENFSTEIFRQKFFDRNFSTEIFRRKFFEGNFSTIFFIFRKIFLTYNLLTIASFRIGVPSILFLSSPSVTSSRRTSRASKNLDWWLFFLVVVVDLSSKTDQRFKVWIL